MDSGKSPSRFKSAIISITVLDALVLSRKSSFERNGPSFAASTMASAAFSPRPSMLFKDGINFPSTIWNSLDCLGEKAADAIVEAAKDGPFLSKDDFWERTRVSKSVTDLMSRLGLLGNIPESNQISIFDLV